MIRKDKVFRKGQHKTHIRMVEGYSDESGKVKQRTIKSFGYLEDQKDQVAFMAEVEKFNAEFFKNKNNLKDDFNKPFYESNHNTIYNYGYKFLEAVYNSLNIDSFFDSIYNRCQYQISDVFKFLVIERILNPDSKRATLQKINTIFGKPFDFQLHDIYRSLDFFSDHSISLQKHLNERIKSTIGRDATYAYYDVTNYYTTIDIPDNDGLRQRGVSKEHRLEPIVQLGLFIDNNGLPISMSLFSGNTADTKTLQPVMNEIKKDYNLDRLIVVADKGLNSTDNINYICNNNDGYVVSQILKGKKGKRYQEKLFNENNYIRVNDRFKYQIFEETYQGKDINGNPVDRKRKVLIYWKLEDAIQAARKRDEKLDKAIKSLGNNAYAIKHSYEEYIKEIHSIGETGEICDKVERCIDDEKALEEAKYDGYFCIITSEIDYDYNKILNAYSGLWKIEESFRITKSDLSARPIYLQTQKHINAHFLICYCALLIVRMLQYRLNNKLSAERIIKALNSSNCLIEERETIKVLKNTDYQAYKKETTFLTEDAESLQDFLLILEKMEVEIPRARYETKKFKEYLNSIKY